MKKTVRLVAIAMVAVVLCLALASCGKTLSGKYSFGSETLGTGTTYSFSGKKVTITGKLAGAELYSVEAEYKIADGKITITLPNDADEDAKDIGGTFDFAETENGIKIGIVEYKKVD